MEKCSILLALVFIEETITREEDYSAPLPGSDFRINILEKYTVHT
jgi:hypothetical protein